MTINFGWSMENASKDNLCIRRGVRIVTAALPGNLIDGQFPFSQETEYLKPPGIGNDLAKIGMELHISFFMADC